LKLAAIGGHGLSRAGKRRREHLPVRGYDFNGEALDRDGVARLDHAMDAALFQDVLVSREDFRRGAGRLHAGSVVNEVAHGKLFEELRNTAHMVVVIVRDHQVIDPLYAGNFGSGGERRAC